MHDLNVRLAQSDEVSSDSSDGEGWLGRFEADDDDPRGGTVPDVRDSIRLPGEPVPCQAASGML